jgi:alanine racemase
LTKAFIHLKHLTHNLRLLQRQAAQAEVWPVLKANGYGQIGQSSRRICSAWAVKPFAAPMSKKRSL